MFRANLAEPHSHSPFHPTDSMKKILVIEDEPNIRETLVDLLEMNNYEVVTACDGKEGITMAQETEPDLIISDIMMPEKNGLEVLENLVLENTDQLPPPFIFLTAKSDHDDIRKGMNLGADDYLLKPFKVNDLVSTVERNLAKRENMNEQMLNAERERISTFLHDGVQQLLVIGHLNLSRLKYGADRLNELEQKMLDQSSQVLEQAIQEMRDLSHGLVDDKTLKECIQESCDKINDSGSLNVELHYQTETKIDIQDQRAIFNIINELLNNILKHANAKRASISLVEEPQTLIVAVEDDGDGFDPIKEAFGIKKIKKTIQKLGGQFEVNSVLKSGTKITFNLPIKNKT